MEIVVVRARRRLYNITYVCETVRLHKVSELIIFIEIFLKLCARPIEFLFFKW